MSSEDSSNQPAITDETAPAGVSAQDLTADKIPPRMPLDEFVKDADLMVALVRGVRAMKARKPSDPLSWFYQAAIHGVPKTMIDVAAVGDAGVNDVEKAKYWNQCPHFGQESANFLPWHRGYTYYFERILRAHTGEPRFALPYWDYSRPENYRFPREFGTKRLAVAVDGDDANPLWHDDRNLYFASWEHWSGNNLPYSQLTPEAVDWSPARDSKVFFGASESLGLAGAVGDNDPGTRGRLESFPHDPIHRLTGIIVPDQVIPDPDNPGQVKTVEGFSLGMSGPPTAGFDPIFCVHHSNIDRLWAEWACMEGKEWGQFPPQEWFDEKKWFFFDVVMDGGQLKAIEVNRPRKEYFNYTALGISFKYDDTTKTPLALPDPIPSAPLTLATKKSVRLAKIDSPLRVSGLRPERITTASAADRLRSPFEAVMTLADAASPAGRIMMRINGINLKAIHATGFDVHLTAKSATTPRRADPSFVGSIALFRHEGHEHSGTGNHEGHDGHGGHGGHGGHAASEAPADVFDITEALIAAGETDPSRMYVVIVPFSLAAAVDGQKAIAEPNTLAFDSIEFFSTQ